MQLSCIRFPKRKPLIFCTLCLLFLVYILLIFEPKLGVTTIKFIREQSTARSTINHNSVAVLKPHPVVTVNLFDASREDESLQTSASKHNCVRFLTPVEESRICVYPDNEDRVVSRNLIRTGMWSKDLVSVVESFLRMHPDTTLLDLGCNIGVFTIYAAKLGNRVVSVDANKFNLMLLSRSLDIGNLHENVTMIWNAISDVYRDVTLQPMNEYNVGGWTIEHNETDTNADIRTITLNDLIFLLAGRKVFIKMDIQGSEWKALKGASKFFKTVNVSHVLMEFVLHTNETSGRQITDFMTDHGFRPMQPVPIRPLKVSEIRNWPYDVLWSKVYSTELDP